MEEIVESIRRPMGFTGSMMRLDMFIKSPVPIDLKVRLIGGVNSIGEKITFVKPLWSLKDPMLFEDIMNIVIQSQTTWT